MKIKRFLAFVVAFAMVMSVMPAMSLTASAAAVTLEPVDDGLTYKIYPTADSFINSNWNTGDSYNGISQSYTSYGDMPVIHTGQMVLRQLVPTGDLLVYPLCTLSFLREQN